MSARGYRRIHVLPLLSNGKVTKGINFFMNQLSFRKYRRLRIIFWLSFGGGFAFISAADRPDIAGILFICAFISSTVSIFMPCPYCGKTIGFRRVGIFWAGNSFGGWCLHCGKRLFLRSPETNNKAMGK
jgi:pimeloyl-ACP methyl ester carboxylesterase